MRTLLLATAAVFAISCGSALAASAGGSAGDNSGGSAGGAGQGGGNAGLQANALSTPKVQPPMTANNQTPPTTLSTGTVQSKTSMNPSQNASGTGSQ
jgi:hypothetical protein